LPRPPSTTRSHAALSRTNPPPQTTTAFGGGAAAALALLSYVSLQYYRRGHLCKPATTASLAVALSVGGVSWGRYVAARQPLPAPGAFAALSAAMALFYAWSLALGPAPGKRPPAAAAAAAKKKAG
jgi:hypothetical protein